jgi:hypothetical protein
MSRRRSRIAVALGAAALAYLAFLALGGLIFAGCVEDRVRERLAAALDSEVTIGSTSFSLWRGRVELEDVVAVRKGGGLELRVDSVDADVAGWGAVLFDRDIDRAVARGAHMTLSARGLVALARRDREPLRVAELVIEDASLAISPTALLPGLGRMQTVVTRAVARPADLTGGLSWLNGLTEIDASLAAPGGVAVTTGYKNGQLALGGSLFGSTPISVPFQLPELDPGASELEHVRVVLTEVMKVAGKRVLGEAAKDAVKGKLKGLLD